jgi:phosphonatase-like hydrolase
MNIQLVVFDMAGTTVRDDDAVNLCLREALAPMAAVTRAEVNAVMGLPKPVAIRELLGTRRSGRRTVTPEMVAAIHDDFLARMLLFYRTGPGVEPMPHALEAFHQLKEAGVSIALDTGFSRPIVDAVLTRLGWEDGLLLDATVASDEVPQGRPHPDLIFKAMELTGVADPKTVAKVGDTPSDLLEGAAAGCGLVVGVTCGTHTREELAPHPHTHLIGSLRELPSLVFENIFGAAPRHLSAAAHGPR